MSDLNILYEDNHVIVVEKPIGVLSQEDHTKDPDLLTLVKTYLKEKYQKPGDAFLGLVHRLDRMVGGIMVFAKTSKAASRLSDQVRRHVVDKKYLAVVHGNIRKEDTLVHYLIKDSHKNLVQVTDQNNPNGKYAELSFKRLDYKESLSLVDINLKTGRPHQIRIQFSTIGHPLYGDRRYGKQNDKGDIALFAYSLSFDHPTTKERLSFSIMPKTFPFSKFINIS